MSSAPNVVPGTGLAATAATSGGVETTRVYYQDTRGGVFEIVGNSNSWTPATTALFQAAPNTPLAAINWDDGEEVRVYYLDQSYAVREICYSVNRGTWIPGVNFSHLVNVAPKSSLAAYGYVNDSGIHIRVYCQEAESLNIQELVFDEHNIWKKGSTLTSALDGTGIAATVYNSGIPAFRVYYQLGDLTLQEQMRNGSAAAWTTGGFKPGDAPAGTPIAVLGLDKTVPHLQVYWLSVERAIVRAQKPEVGLWTYVSTPVVGLPYYTSIAVAQINDGASVRLYYQRGDASIVEVRGDSDGAVWGEEAVVVKA